MGLFERGYGLVIGVGEYSDPAWDVPIAERDARELYEVLIDPEIGAYDRGRVSMVLGKEATSTRIREELRILGEQAEPDATVFICFTGHGALGDDNLYYLASSDAQLSDDLQRIRGGSGYSIARLAAALQAIQAQKLLLIINACASGHLSGLASRGSLGSSVIPDSDARQILESGRGRAIITASRPDEPSYFQKTDTYSYFGRALVNGLRGQDVSAASGYVGLFDLYNAIYSQVQKATAPLGYQQHPRLTLVDGEGPFPVALYPGSLRRDERLIEHNLPANAHIVQITIGTQNIDQRITIDNSRSGIRIGDHNQVGDITHGDSAGEGITRDTIYVSGSTEFDLNRLIEGFQPPRAGFPTILIPSTDPPPLDPTPPPISSAPLIDLGNAQIGSFTIKGDVVQGNLSKTVFNQGDADNDDAPDLLGDLQKIRGQIEQARNVDADARDDAANKIKQAHRAIDQGDHARAIQRINQALEILDALNNGYINSAAKKLRKVRDAL